MTIDDRVFRTAELPAFPGRLGEIDALLHAARGAVGESPASKNIARIIDGSPVADIRQKPLW